MLDVEPDQDLEARCVYLPNLTYNTVKSFIDDVYAGLCSNEFLLDITYDLADVFGMLAEEKPPQTTGEQTQKKDSQLPEGTYSINVNSDALGMYVAKY